MNTLTLDEYQPLALRTAKPLSTLIDNLEHAALGLITETGEAASPVKRIAIYDKPLTQVMRENMIEEIGDDMWYCALLANNLGVPLSSLLVADIGPARDLKQAALLLGMSVGHVIQGVVFLREADQAVPSDSAIDMRHILDAASRVVTVLDRFCTLLNITLGEVMYHNIVKLRVRFPEAYDSIAAEARADKGGADHRSS